MLAFWGKTPTLQVNRKKKKRKKKSPQESYAGDGNVQVINLNYSNIHWPKLAKHSAFHHLVLDLE